MKVWMIDSRQNDSAWCGWLVPAVEGRANDTHCRIKVFGGPRLDTMGPRTRHLPFHRSLTTLKLRRITPSPWKCEVVNARRHWSIIGWIKCSVISYVQDEFATFARTTSQYRARQVSKRPLKNFANKFNNYRQLLYTRSSADANKPAWRV